MIGAIIFLVVLISVPFLFGWLLGWVIGYWRGKKEVWKEAVERKLAVRYGDGMCLFQPEDFFIMKYATILRPDWEAEAVREGVAEYYEGHWGHKTFRWLKDRPITPEAAAKDERVVAMLKEIQIQMNKNPLIAEAVAGMAAEEIKQGLLSWASESER